MKNLKIKSLLVVLTLVCANSNILSQNYVAPYLSNNNEIIYQNFSISDSSGWFEATETSNLSPTYFMNNLNSIFDLGSFDTFVLEESKIDNYPFLDNNLRLTHDKYIQTYKGLEVEFTDLMIHHRDNRIYFVNCDVVHNLNMNTSPTFNESQALTLALNQFDNATIFAWQDSLMETEVKENLSDSNATYFPQGQLLLAKLNTDKNYNSNQYVLAWKFEIYTSNTQEHKEIYINAQTGEFIKEYEQICTDGTASVHSYGNQTIDTKQRGWPYNDHILKTDGAGRNINTKYGIWNFNARPQVDDDDDNWGTHEQDGTSAHWAASQSWDFWKNTYGRNGCKNNGRNLQVLIDDNITYAYYTKWPGADRITVGYRGGNLISSIDNVGHEFTHGVIEHTANLKYQRESGALNESFADIFGVMTERYSDNGIIQSWEIGDDMNRVIRNLSHPSIYGDPSVYQGSNWVNTNCGTPNQNNDHCGVHTNSGVQNYWFYLLTTGSVGAPDGTFNNIAVDGIGAETSASIALYNLENFLNKNSDYNSARLGSHFSCNYLYGFCSKERKSNQNAWAAVGLGNPDVSLDINGPFVIYHTASASILGGMPKQYTAVGDVNNTGYTWYYSGPWTTHTGGSGNQHFFIDNFNNTVGVSPGYIEVKGRCESIKKQVRFSCIDCWYPVGDGTITGGVLGLAVFPNPVNDILNIRVEFDVSEENSNKNIKVVNMLGNTMYQYTSTQIPEMLDVSQYPAGTYILVITLNDEIMSLQFVKE